MAVNVFPYFTGTIDTHRGTTDSESVQFEEFAKLVDENGETVTPVVPFNPNV